MIKDYAIKTKIILSVDWLVTCRYPLYIDIVISMIKYWIRLHEDKTNCILKAALDEKKKCIIMVSIVGLAVFIIF